MKELIEKLTLFIEMCGVLVIIIGMTKALADTIRKRRAGFDQGYDEFKKTLGKSILLGLEFLVAADIIDTVAVEPTLDNVTLLGLIVLIRTFLSFSLEIELEGKLPWRRGSSEKIESLEVVPDGQSALKKGIGFGDNGHPRNQLK